jgi:threonine/homoserine/homoserine lactone efflux protein
MSIESLLLYLLTWLLVALTPGPAVICVMSQAAKYGLQAGFRGIAEYKLETSFSSSALRLGW